MDKQTVKVFKYVKPLCVRPNVHFRTRVFKCFGLFHRFSTESYGEETWPVAIVELPDGTVITPPATDVQFMYDMNIQEAMKPGLSLCTTSRLLSACELPVRVINVMRRHGWHTIGDLVQVKRSDLKACDGLGKKGFTELEDMLYNHNLILKG